MVASLMTEADCIGAETRWLRRGLAALEEDTASTTKNAAESRGIFAFANSASTLAGICAQAQKLQKQQATMNAERKVIQPLSGGKD